MPLSSRAPAVTRAANRSRRGFLRIEARKSQRVVAGRERARLARERVCEARLGGRGHRRLVEGAERIRQMCHRHAGDAFEGDAAVRPSRAPAWRDPASAVAGDERYERRWRCRDLPGPAARPPTSFGTPGRTRRQAPRRRSAQARPRAPLRAVPRPRDTQDRVRTAGRRALPSPAGVGHRAGRAASSSGRSPSPSSSAARRSHQNTCEPSRPSVATKHVAGKPVPRQDRRGVGQRVEVSVVEGERDGPVRQRAVTRALHQLRQRQHRAV